MLQKNEKKVDLLSFQKSLNEQFLAIFESKKNGETLSALGTTDKLGLLDNIENINFFLPLKELKNISMTNSFEELRLTKSWVCGFNQIRGEVYTILDLNKVFELILNKKTDIQSKKMNNNNRIVYLKNYNESKLGLIINNLLLEYTAEYTPIMRFKKNNENMFWEMEEEIDFDIFIKKTNMSEKEYELINKFYGFTKENKKFSISEFEEDIKNSTEKDLFLYLIGDIYLDSMGKKPIFTLNIENLTKVLINVFPF